MVKGEPFDVERVALKSLASGYGVFECRISCSWECMWDSVRRARFGKKTPLCWREMLKSWLQLFTLYYVLLSFLSLYCFDLFRVF